MEDQLEFFVVPTGKNCADANEAVWTFLAERGEGTGDKANAEISIGGLKVSGIRVTRSEMEMIRDSAKSFRLHFRILSVNSRTEEVKVHFGAPLSTLPMIQRGSDIPKSSKR